MQMTRAAPFAVHPRWRGEHGDVFEQHALAVRFIPAGAGNTGGDLV